MGRSAWVNTRARALAVSALDRLAYGPVPSEREYPSEILRGAPGNDAIREVLLAGDSCLIARVGLIEMRTVSYYLRYRRGAVRIPYEARLRRAMRNNAGFFPTDDQSLDRFAVETMEAVSGADVVAVWHTRGEGRVVSQHGPEARLVHLDSLNSMWHPNPWSSALAGKKVLVVHPFTSSIESQYRERRTEIFADPDVLPEFDLKTLRPPQSIAGNDCGFASWFDALEDTCARIEAVDFDVAVIGAGAYGLALAAFVKGLGRQAVLMAGSTQLLFGITGRRWEEPEFAEIMKPIITDAWIRPQPEETPSNADRVEGGCYW